MSPSTTAPACDLNPIMQRLKADTQRLHDETEHGEFNKALVMGRIPLEGYVEMLAQLLLIHRALEGHLKRHRDRHPALSSVLADHQFQEPYLLDDLAHFGRDVDTIAPLNSTRHFVAAIDELAVLAPAGLLGVHYVFEGSNNGSRYIARALRKAYALDGVAGLRYFDPYGDRQTELWQAFKDAMNAVAFTPEETEAVSRAAADAFSHIMAVHRELGERFSAAQTAGALRCPFAHNAR